MQRRRFVAACGAAVLAQSGRLVRAASVPRIRLGQIGTGHAHAAGKMEAVRRLSDLYDVVGIVEPDDAQWSRVGGKAPYDGLPRRTEAELLGSSDVRAVSIETRMSDSIAAAARAVASGKHLHLDKPGALEHAPFRAMRFEAERRGLTVQMGYMLRYNPAFELLFRAARAGWFGDILEVDAMMGKLAPDGMRRELEQLPGGGMFELACHIIDAAVTLLGKPAAVHAFTKRTRAEASDKADATADNQLAVLEYPRATATIRCNHADPFGGPRRRFHVAGTKGAMEIMPLESGRCRLMLSRPHEDFRSGVHDLTLKVPPGRYDDEFIDLAKVLRGEKRLAWNAAHDVAVHETVLRASGAWPGA